LSKQDNKVEPVGFEPTSEQVIALPSTCLVNTLVFIFRQVCLPTNRLLTSVNT